MAVTISQELLPRLLARFPDADLRIESSRNLIATIPAKCQETGDLHISDDGDEATVFIENVTHSHFNPYNSELSDEERARWVADDVIEFLEKLLSDRILLWAVDGGRRSGGWRSDYSGEIPTDVPKSAAVFIWSRRLR
jgi:hypothetical protein